jgi:transcriptional regulator with XRE-family HTH domain
MHPIERYRKIKGMTQAQLAQAMGVSIPTVQRWEAGAEPRPGKLAKLADLLGVDVGTLLDDITGWKAS